ncbi:SulP family inorganic anion transporter [Actinomycetota bacterium]
MPLSPGVDALTHHDRRWLRGDVLAGVTVAAYLVPQVMAYAVVAGLPPVAGLWAVLAPLLAYAVLGSSRQLSVGPESTTALMTASGVAALVGIAGVERRAEVAAVLALAVGVVCLLGALGRLGFLSEFLSKPVLVGYLAGVAVLMIVSQLGKVTRLSIEATTPVDQTREVLGRLGEVHLPSLVLALGLLVLLLALARWARYVPGPLVAILLSAALVRFTPLGEVGLKVVGAVPRGLPMPQIPDFTSVPMAHLVPAALGIALVGYSDNILTGRAFAARHGTRVDANQEMLALGVANVATGLSQGFPVSSSGSRTVLADAMGARTQLHSLVSVACVVGTLLFLGGILESFPTAALGAIVIYAALRLIDVPEWRRIARFRSSELILAVATAVAVLTLGVLSGIGAAITLSLLDLLRRLAVPHDGVLGYVPGLAGMHDVDDYPDARQVPGLVVYRYDSPLFFANADNFVSRAMHAVDSAPTPCEWFLLNAEANVQVDLTAVDALDQLREELDKRGIVFAMARVKQELRDQLAAAGFVADVGEERIFATLPAAVHAYAADYERRCGRALSDEGLTLPPIT